MRPTWLYTHLPRREVLFALIVALSLMSGVCIRDCAIGAHGYRLTISPMEAIP